MYTCTCTCITLNCYMYTCTCTCIHIHMYTCTGIIIGIVTSSGLENIAIKDKDYFWSLTIA